jgi:hypothetical protein
MRTLKTNQHSVTLSRDSCTALFPSEVQSKNGIGPGVGIRTMLVPAQVTIQYTPTVFLTMNGTDTDYTLLLPTNSLHRWQYTGTSHLEPINPAEGLLKGSRT